MNRLTRLAPAAALACSLAACSDGTSPGDVNPEVLNGRLNNLIATFEQNAAFNSLLALAPYFPNYAGTALFEAVPMPVVPSTGYLGSRIQVMRQQLSRAAAMSARSDIQALFPANVLGKTLEWSTQTSGYVIGNQTGAPATGVRILIYVVDQQGTGPVVPLQQLGYVDFTDESTPQFDRLGVLLRLGNATIADYDITNTITTQLNTLRAVGRLNAVSGGGFADFDIQAAEDGADFFQWIQEITGSDGTNMVVDLSGDDTTSDILIAVGDGDNTLEMEVGETAQAMTGEIRYNGVVVATVSGNGGEPTFIGVDGNPLPAEQVEALGSIFIAATIFALILTFGILGPAFLVF